MKPNLTVYRKYILDFNGNKSMPNWPRTFMNFKVIIYKPKIFNLARYETSFLINLLWFIACFGKFYIVFLMDEKKIVHFSYVTSKVFRFPFMKSSDLQIGPCATDKQYQGKGIFTNVLKLISDVELGNGRTIWTYTTLSNLSSQKAFERAGYQFVSYALMNRRTKLFRMVDKL